MSKTRVFIYGSCVSRDTFEYLDPDQFELVQYVARQSALSAYTRPVTLIAPPNLESRFQQRMVAGDFASNLQTLVPELAPRTDLVLVDLTDERLGAFVLPDGSVVTRSTELIQAGVEQDLPEGSQHMPFGSDLHFQYWTQGIQAIGQMLRYHMQNATVVLLDIPWAARSESGDASPTSFGLSALDANRIFASYARVATQALHARTISLPASEVASSPDHPWGDAPFHYAESVYLKVAQQIAGTSAPQKPNAARPDTSMSDLPQSGPYEGKGQTIGASSPESQDTNVARVDTTTADLGLDSITSTAWRFSRANGTHVREPIFLRANGTIDGHSNQNEARWTLDHGYIAFMTEDGRISTRFDQPVSTTEAVRFEGAYLLNPKMQLVHVLESIEFDWESRSRPTTLTRREMADEIDKYGWSVGDHTIGRPRVNEPFSGGLTIGKYSTIGANVSIYLRLPYSSQVANYDFHAQRNTWPGGRRQVNASEHYSPVRIGSDVWIGDNVSIGPGVTIGDGAYVLPGAVLMDHVRPYSVVTGNPATEISRRFSESEIESLLTLRWWDLPDADVNEHIPALRGDPSSTRQAIL